MTLRTRLLWLSMSTVAIVVIVLMALHLNSLIVVWLDQAIERSDSAGREMQSFLMKRIEERMAARQPAPATVAEAKQIWNEIIRDDSELELVIQQSMVQSRSIVEIEVAGESGRILAASDPARVSTPMAAKQELRVLRRASPLDRLAAILSSRTDYETRVKLGIAGQESPVFQIQVLVSPILLRAAIVPELWNAGVAALLALAAAAALAYVAARIALRPLARIEHVLDRIITGDATELPPLEDRELAAVESKLSLVGAQVTGARRDASQMRSAMSSIARGVAHEFKNPLNAIALRLELLRARVAQEAPEAESDIDILTQEVARLDRVVKTFLDLSRPVTLERDRLPAAQLARDVLQLVQPEAEQLGIVTELIESQAPVVVSADEGLLRQALLNVVKNAMEAMTGGGQLRVTVSRRDGECEIAVSDTGPGIPAQIRERIFDPYFSTKERGSGIGLALTLRALQLHGGTVEVESEAGQGSTFRLRLPLEQKGQGAAAAATGSAARPAATAESRA
jgi:signal transduction histidine kinase